MDIKCLRCGRSYDAQSDCQLYDPKRRPLHEGLQATVLCACGQLLEVTVKRGRIRRLLPLSFGRRTWEFYLDIKER
ncbi:MAG TPA: hypothetical protein VI855_08480 [Dehalococcoidia bacterium]|nr:hypothetical protein [Dehalococcoidia bacterium]